MNYFLKKLFPKKKSDRAFVRHFFWGILVVLFVQVTFLSVGNNIIGTFSNKLNQLANVVSSILVLETNNFRTTNTEKELIVSDVLTQAAQMKANDMAKREYFSHRGPDGEEPWTWFQKANYRYDYAGENLAVDFTESEDVTQGWINSATHKANLLNKNFTEIGVATAKGKYQGRDTIYVVQFFGTPASSKIAEEIVEPVKPITPVVSKPVVDEVIDTEPDITVASVATTTQLSEIDPTTAVATVFSLPAGEVLGAESGSVAGSIIQTKMLFVVVATIILALLFGLIFNLAHRLRKYKNI
jgi:hypothetical protein